MFLTDDELNYLRKLIEDQIATDRPIYHPLILVNDLFDKVNSEIERRKGRPVPSKISIDFDDDLNWTAVSHDIS